MRKFKENVIRCLIYLASGLVVATAIYIIGYIVVKGIGKIDLNFITGAYSSKGNGGISSMIITTFLSVVISLAISAPIGIFGAIYLSEYAKGGKVIRIIRYATDTLAGIPSIVFGIFGMAFFVTALKLNYSLLSGSLTLAIMVLPVIISTTEEALKAVPSGYREASIALGSTKFELIYKIVLPTAIPGILSGIILSMGRIVGESAAVILTLGTALKLPKTILSSGRTLTVHAYLLAGESGDISGACAVGIVLIVIVLTLNMTAKLITRRLNKNRA